MKRRRRLLLDAAYQRTLDLITERKTEVEKVAHLLLETKTITYDDIIDLIGPRPYVSEAYQEYVIKKHLKKKEEESEDLKDEEEVTPVDGLGGLTPGFALKV